MNKAMVSILISFDRYALDLYVVSSMKPIIQNSSILDAVFNYNLYESITTVWPVPPSFFFLRSLTTESEIISLRNPYMPMTIYFVLLRAESDDLTDLGCYFKYSCKVWAFDGSKISPNPSPRTYQHSRVTSITP